MPVRSMDTRGAPFYDLPAGYRQAWPPQVVVRGCLLLGFHDEFTWNGRSLGEDF